MLDDFKEEQKVAHKILKNALLKNQIIHAYLIETNNYLDSFSFALSFAKSLECPNFYTNKELCGSCTQCKRIDNSNFSEIKIIEPDGLWIKKEQLEQLQKEFSTKSIESKFKIYIIKDAEKLNSSAANSILKFLEEPEDNIIAILLTNNIYEMLSTIVSRCQILKLTNSKNKTSEFLSSISDLKDSTSDEESNNILLQKVIDFVEKYERNGIDTILYMQSIWHYYFTERENVLTGFEIMILFYKEILNYLINGQLENFIDYKNLINFIVQKNNVDKIRYKLEILLDLKQKIYYNINNQLLMDKLVIEWEK